MMGHYVRRARLVGELAVDAMVATAYALGVIRDPSRPDPTTAPASTTSANWGAIAVSLTPHPPGYVDQVEDVIPSVDPEWSGDRCCERHYEIDLRKHDSLCPLLRSYLIGGVPYDSTERREFVGPYHLMTSADAESEADRKPGPPAAEDAPRPGQKPQPTPGAEHPNTAGFVLPPGIDLCPYCHCLCLAATHLPLCTK